MKAEEAAALRAPFPEQQVGKLPRIVCGKCRDASSKVCSDHTKTKCSECDNWITTAHVHLDYVGHAEVRSRLLEVDPSWWWEPLALDDRGLPLVVEQGADAVLWIKLSVAGSTRLGVGTVPRNSFERDKQLIGDALRNAAMSFGVALDLWSKARDEQHHATQRGQDKPKRRSGKSETSGSAPTEPSGSAPSPAASRACAKCGEPITGKVHVLNGERFHDTVGCRPGTPVVNEARDALARATRSAS